MICWVNIVGPPICAAWPAQECGPLQCIYCRSGNFHVFHFSRISDFGTFHMFTVREFSFLFSSAIIIILFKRFANLSWRNLVKIKTSQILPDLQYYGSLKQNDPAALTKSERCMFFIKINIFCHFQLKIAIYSSFKWMKNINIIFHKG